MIVIKLGGTEGVDFKAICEDVKSLLETRMEIVLVHGGSAETNDLSNKLGYPPRFITSPSGYTSRYTDRNTLEIFAMAVKGKINTLLVEQLQGMKVNAFGLSGMDGRFITASRKSSIQSIENGRRKIIRDDYTGKIEVVDPAIIQVLLGSGITPVIAPLAISTEGEALNVDADRAAAMIAASLKAEILLLLTGAPGLLKSFPNEASLIGHLKSSQIHEAQGYAEGRMKKKILAADEALNGGVKEIIIADGRIDHPVSAALAGKGTHIIQG